MKKIHIIEECNLVFFVKYNGVKSIIRNILPMHFVDVISSLKKTKRLAKKENWSKIIKPIINFECL
tara:strand:+ start:181 stop:378 length:198 start_codon:yes stop_codon:yes gene_type:complete